jgi:hypothetical protein
MSKRGDREYLADIHEAIQRIQTYTTALSYAQFLADEKTQETLGGLRCDGRSGKGLRKTGVRRRLTRYGCKPGLNRRQHRRRGRLSRFHQLWSTVESIPFDSSEIRCDDEIARLPPAILVAGLHDLEASTNDLKHVGWWPATGRRRQVHRHNVRCAEFARKNGGNLGAHRAVD